MPSVEAAPLHHQPAGVFHVREGSGSLYNSTLSWQISLNNLEAWIARGSSQSIVCEAYHSKKYSQDPLLHTLLLIALVGRTRYKPKELVSLKHVLWHSKTAKYVNDPCIPCMKMDAFRCPALLSSFLPYQVTSTVEP